MAIEYRSLRHGEQEALITFWTSFIMNSRLKDRVDVEDSYEARLRQASTPQPDLSKAVIAVKKREQALAYNGWASHLATIPHWQEHCYVAVDEEGSIISALQVWPRLVRDIDGKPVLVGHITHLATTSAYRGRGHASNLLELAKVRLQSEGCQFAILFTHDTGRYIYERLGWQMLPLSYRWGNIRWPNGKQDWYEANVIQTPYQIVEYPLADVGFETLARIYDAYNADRPFTIIRDSSYWHSYFIRRLQGWSSLVIKLAQHRDTGEVGGYLIVTSKPVAKNEAELVEIGILPGHERAVAPLLDAGANMAGWIDDGIGLYLPNDSVIRNYEDYEFDTVGEYMMLGILVGRNGGHVYFDESRRLMATPLATEWDDNRIRTLCEAPGAVFWLLDDSYKALLLYSLLETRT